MTIQFGKIRESASHSQQNHASKDAVFPLTESKTKTLPVRMAFW